MAPPSSRKSNQTGAHNTESLFAPEAEKSKDKWYAFMSGRAQGPFSSLDMVSLIQKHEINAADYVWKRGLSDWKRLVDVPNFKTLFPKRPSKKWITRLSSFLSGSAPNILPPEKDEWFLSVRNTQYGPFSSEEIRRLLEHGKLSTSEFVWKDGWKDWLPLTAVDAFSESTAPKEKTLGSMGGKTKISNADKRTSPRRPLVARILLTHNRGAVTGVCRDLSAGGMQVLSGALPGPVGMELDISVSPTATDELKPFVARAVIVRYLIDGRGFVLSFKNLDGFVKASIEDYLNG